MDIKKIIIVIFFLIAFAFLLKVLFLPDYPDFRAHYYGGYHILHGQNPYVKDSNYFTTQVYPPSDLLLMSIFTFLPYVIAIKVWVVLSLVMLFVAITVLLRLFGIKNSYLVLLLCTAVFLSFPVKFTLGMGQINMLILLLLSVFLYMYKKNKKVSGIILGLMFAIKFFPFLVFPYLLLKRQWRTLLYSLITILVAIIICILFLPEQTNLYFVKHVFPDLLSSWKADYYNQAVSGFIARATTDNQLRELCKLFVSFVMFCVTFFVVFKKRKQADIITYLELSVVITLTVLINNFSWQHHFIFLIPGYLAAFIYLIQYRASNKLWFVLMVSYALISVNIQYPLTFPVIIQSHVLYGGILLWGLLLYLLLNTKKNVYKK